METPNKIMEMISAGESLRQAFKSSGASLESLGATICAFLNSGGGQILVGVRDDGGIDGGVQSELIEQRLRPLASEQFLTPSAVWEITTEPTDNGSIVLIDVPSGADLPYVFQDTIYIRSGSRTRAATGTETRKLIERRYLQGPRWERQPALEVTFNDLDETQILKTAHLAAEKRGWVFADPKDPRSILERLNLLDNGRITRGAVVLFAKEAGHILPQSHVRLTTFVSDQTGSEIRRDQVYRGHLFAHLDAYEDFIQTNVSITSLLTASKQTREDRPQYPYWSLREAFRNALVHRDYESGHGRLAVSLYPSRLEIWNSGNLPEGLTLASLANGGRSLPVNPDIAQVVFLRGLVDLLGRGTRKIVEEFKSQGLAEPKWRKQSGGIYLTLQAHAPTGSVPKDLNKRQIKLLHQLKPGDSTSMNILQKETDGEVSERSLRNDLSLLVKLGYLTNQGRGKSTFYVRSEKVA
jgi:ATP-dependent DNA helicase RecG